MIYIVCFLSSAFFIWLGTKHVDLNVVSYNNGKRAKSVKPRITYIAIGILLPCIIAALRDVSVGSDVTYYVVPFFERAVSSGSFSSYTRMFGVGSDIAYLVLNYIVSRFTDDIGWLFFSYELIIILFVFLGLWRFKDRARPWYSMLFYYLFFYNMTLSTVRQSIACAISFYAISVLLTERFTRKSWIKAGVFTIIAFLFHATAVVSIVIMLLCFAIVKKRTKPLYVGLIAFALAVGVRLGSQYFIRFILLIVSLFSVKYSSWAFTSFGGVGASGYLSVILVGCVVTLINWLLTKYEKEGNWNFINSALLTLNIIYVLAMLFDSNITFVPRMLYYFQMLWCLPLAQTGRLFKKNKTSQTLSMSLIIAFAMFYWVYFYAIAGVHGTYPYILR